MTDTGFLVTLALALIAATIGAAIAVRLGQSAILGYVAAGVLIGPYTAGPDRRRAHGRGAGRRRPRLPAFRGRARAVHPRPHPRARIAFVGGVVQVAASVALGYVVAIALGFRPLEALFFGAFISQSSSTVIAKILGERGELDSQHGHIALGWTMLQDLSTVVLVVLLTALSQGGDLTARRGHRDRQGAHLPGDPAATRPVRAAVPFERVAALRSREVFVLTVVAVALGTAYISALFGLSLALGAFLAGLLVSESDISHQVSSELWPLRDVFAGVFFVSIGMFFNPAFVLAAAGLVAVAVILIVPVKAALVAGLSRVLGAPGRSAILAGVTARPGR